MNVALVTGSSKGIGRNITELLLSNGWRVYGVSRATSDIDAANFIPISADLASHESIEIIAEAIEETSLDLLVSNAGVAFEEPADEISVNSYQNIYDVNVRAPMLLVSKLSKKLERATIISISSVSDRLIDKDYALYCSSKAANTRYFEAVAQQLENAKVFNLLPDYVDTPMLHGLQQGRDFAWDKTLSPKALAELSLLLVTDKLSVPSGSNIIVVNNALKEDLKSAEKLFGYNVDTRQLTEL